MKIKEILRKILRRLSITPPQRDYYRDWISDEGKIYRQKVCERQKKDGSKPLVANPTMDEIRMDVFLKYSIDIAIRNRVYLSCYQCTRQRNYFRMSNHTYPSIYLQNI